MLSMDSIIIRSAQKRDVPDILAIYGPEVLYGHASMEMDVPSHDEIWERINKVNKEAPWLIAEYKHKVVGYCYAPRHNDRIGYRYTRSLSIYVHSDYKNMKIGQNLVIRLLEILEFQGYKKIVSLISLPNDASEKLHLKLGFEKAFELKEIGFKHQRWCSIAYYQKVLNTEPPGIIRDYREIKEINL